MSIMVIIMGTLIFALLIISIIVFLFGLQTLIAAQNTKSELDNDESNNPGGRGSGGNEGGQPGSASSQNRAQRSDSAAGGAGGRLSRANGGSRN
jgi:Na+-transporting NADH:ubiquinone oxidoreductase subunit NqrF